MATYSISGRISLMVAHCAGMLDLIALPVWVGALIQHYKFDPQQAGGLVTVFLLGAVVSSVFLASRFHSLNTRWVAALGFTMAAACFLCLTQIDNYGLMAIVHGIAGVFVGASLSVTHGTIAVCDRPHRMFAIVSTALGVFSIMFLGGAPGVVAKTGGAGLFTIFAAIMVIAALVSAAAFPRFGKVVSNAEQRKHNTVSENHLDSKISSAVWFGVLGVCGMGLVQAMTFSFLERAGADNNFSLAAITGVLVALGVINMFPAPLAAILEKRISARWVLLVAPVIQACLCLVIMSSSTFKPYASAASVFPAVMIFTHTFAFGVLARLDTTGRALAATPAMVMVGAAIGPILGGSLVKLSGYQSIGITALIVSIFTTFCFTRIFSRNRNFETEKSAA